MRKACEFQTSLTYKWLELDHAKELQALSELLDRHPKIAEQVLQDLTHNVQGKGGASGTSADTIFRALLLKQMHGWSYEELHFHLNDSQTFRTFCKFAFAQKTPARSTLAAAIKLIQPETLEKINGILVRDAAERNIESGKITRVDCTVVETLMHPPSDSQLLWDCVRVLSRLMKKTRAVLPAGSFQFPNRKKRAKRRCREITMARRKPQRRRGYVDLIHVSEEIKGKACEALEHLRRLKTPSSKQASLAQKLQRFIELTARVVSQTSRRVIEGQSVPAQEKVVSIFEDHTDIIRKGLETSYGHKICLNVGKTSMVLDCQILEGNPSDRKLAVESMDRQQSVYGEAPQQVVFDGGFTSAANLEALKQRGIEDVVFTKGATLNVSDMAKSLYIYRKLRHFRAGIEGVISYLKRSFGLHRCTWRSWPSFRSYVWSSIVASNLLLMARAVLV